MACDKWHLTCMCHILLSSVHYMLKPYYSHIPKFMCYELTCASNAVHTYWTALAAVLIIVLSRMSLLLLLLIHVI